MPYDQNHPTQLVLDAQVQLREATADEALVCASMSLQMAQMRAGRRHSRVIGDALGAVLTVRAEILGIPPAGHDTTVGHDPNTPLVLWFQELVRAADADEALVCTSMSLQVAQMHVTRKHSRALGEVIGKVLTVCAERERSQLAAAGCRA